MAAAGLIAIPIGPPPDYESSLQPITIPAPPYPGADIELPDYCDVVVTRAPTNQVSYQYMMITC